ncbi:hypothetical protein, partial [Klebsiella quasipneumoniae]|uniref:hypothetical protein n=4 Tax=Klebsiella quasipneumoniae TaxID=1463165 RepID=UPI001C49AE4D
RLAAPCALPALWKTECRKINRERNLPGINIEVVALLSVARAGKYSVVPLFRRVAAAPYPAYVVLSQAYTSQARASAAAPGGQVPCPWWCRMAA